MEDNNVNVEETVKTDQVTQENKAEETKVVTPETKPAEKKLEIDEKEFEQRLVNKYAEGAKKAEKTILEELGYKSKEELQAAITTAKEFEEKFNIANNELTQLKAERMAIKLGANAEIAENVVALLKGKGQEISEENIKAAMTIFQGAKPASQGFGTVPKPQSTTTTKKSIPRVF